MKGQRKRVVMSVQMKAKYSIVEMTREATPVEIDHCKLVYCGCGRWKSASTYREAVIKDEKKRYESEQIQTYCCREKTLGSIDKSR